MNHQKSNRAYILLMALVGFESQAAFLASDVTSASTAPIYSYVTTLSAGPAWTSAGKTQTFFLAPGIEKKYAAAGSTKALAEGELFLGLQKPLQTQLQGQLGLSLVTTSNAQLRGEIWDDADPQFNNYLYSYQVRHSHIALKGKLLADRGYAVIPWVSGSIGIGFNQAHQFDNTPIICEAVKNPNFPSNTKTAFTYTLGFGVQRLLTKNWQMGVGYEFADGGKNTLGRATGQTFNSGLALNHLYAHGLLLNITYIT